MQFSSSSPNSHEYYEELASLAAGGHLSEEETRKLNEHLAQCEHCLHFYQDMLALSAGIQVHAEDLFTAAKYSDNNEQAAPFNSTLGAKSQRRYWVPAAAALFGVLLGSGAVSAYLLRRSPVVANIKVPQGAAAPVPSHAAAVPAKQTVDPEVAQKRIVQLESELAAEHRQAATVTTTSQGSSQYALLEQKADALARSEAAQRAEIGSLNAELTQLRQAQETSRENLQARDERIRVLSAELMASRQPVPASPATVPNSGAIAELLGQRNLHVIDVYDDGIHGQRSRAFGRVFYGEGDSLMFYAFDLPLKAGSDKVVVQAWGQREGSEKNPIQLGIFSQSDASMARWTLRVKDRAQLSKIDAVYVTVERREEKKPTGTPLLYAYLRQSPNHP